MFYKADTRDHGMAHDPFKAIVVPRPIGWIGTKAKDGSHNLAPFSFFNAVSDTPKMVMFSAGNGKDSPRNAEETGQFTASFVSRNLMEAMNMSSIAVPHGVDEFGLAGLQARMGTLVDAPYVADAFAVLECRVTDIVHPRTLDGGSADSTVIFGQVVGIHISETIIRDGKLDMELARPVARMGYMDYSEASQVFEMKRPARPE